MSNSGRKRSPLVADKRYPSKKAAPKPKKAAPGKQRPTARKKQKVDWTVWRVVTWPFRWALRLIWGFGWRIGAISAVLVGLAVAYVYSTLPDVTALLDGRARGSVTLLDTKGEVYAWRGDQFGGAVTVNTVSPHLKNAVVATEDKRFYRHFGLSPRGIASAVRINLREGRGPLSGHGGSTITQQTAKLLCLGVEYDPSQWKSEAAYVKDCRRGSLVRKLKEAVFALAMEAKYSKDEILSIYLNRAYMGGGAYGAEAAAQRYFGKPAAALNVPESAMLAGLLTAPTRLAPTSSLKRSQDRAATVLRMMREQGYISTADELAGQAAPATLSRAAKANAGGYFADWVMAEGPEFFTRNTTEDVIIRTTLDPRIQKAAEEALDHIFATKVKQGSRAQAAIVVMSADGAVRAMVGGREHQVTGAFNRATQAKRQTGSAFKPFVFAAALDLGRSPYDMVDDAPYCLNIPGSGEWCPKNYTKKFLGPVTLTDALKQSLNIPAVKLAQAVGLDVVRAVASGFGIASDLAKGPALALGASESTLLEMTGAYAGILNGGTSVTPYGLIELKLLGSRNPLMTTTGGLGERVIQTKSAQQLVWMMNKVVSEGTGTRALLPDRPVAGKTGTTQAARDAWFLGFSADYVAGVWMGNDDNKPLKGVTGGGLPADIWRETMLRVHQGLPVRPLPMLEPAPAALQPRREIQPTQQQRRTRNQRQRNQIDNILRDLLGAGER